MATVLVVDDNPDLCKAIMQMVRLIGVRADCALGGHEALAHVSGRDVDLILLDYMMPDLDGLSVLARLRENPRTRGVPVVTWTAAPLDELREEALALGASGVLQKGRLDLGTLRPWVEPLLGRA